MKVILYMAVTIDGYIATKEGDSEWVSEVDLESFDNKIKNAGGLILGKTTFNQYKGEMFPIPEVLNIVVTRDKSKQTEEYKNVIFVESAQEAVQIATDNNLKEIILIGGGTVNGLFFAENLIDEIYISVHPLILGDGIRLFENSEKLVELEFMESKNLKEGLAQLHYQVKK